jgi:hypothetical protein
MSPEDWSASLYTIWLDALRTLHQNPNGSLPQVMLTGAWRRKQLQTSLASWAELRHDNVLYAKQSYTAMPVCGYPRGYVEPYPQFFYRLRAFATRAADLLADSALTATNFGRQIGARGAKNAPVPFLRRFAEIMQFLEHLARKELAAQPFTREEQAFLEATIDESSGVCGVTVYSGWYPQLIYDEKPEAFKPTVSDVHTSAGSDREPARVLEEAVGNAEFLVVSIDNQGDRATYVGPVYSYYEFSVDPSARLTDNAWQERLASQPPPRPPWTGVFRAPSKKREL